jgi:hypothetical protein
MATKIVKIFLGENIYLLLILALQLGKIIFLVILIILGFIYSYFSGQFTHSFTQKKYENHKLNHN